MEKRFSNYSQTGIHYDMLHDCVRTSSYRNAILKNAKSFEGKIVADVGCGTGILSLFAAQAGAKRVYAIECTDIANVCEKIIKDNHYDHIITLIRGESEQVELPEKVDIIISEWMGYSLYYEVMLPAVISIRDRFLNEDGVILPSEATLFLTLVYDPEYRAVSLDSWDDVYGFDFHAMKELAFSEVVIDSLIPSFFVGKPNIISHINLHTCTKDDVFLKKEFQFVAEKTMGIDVFATYFDVLFDDLENKVLLSTSPFKDTTHWKNSLFYLTEQITLEKGEKIEGIIEFLPHPTNSTSLLINFKYCINDKVLRQQQFDFQ